jgi:hypothetical protein
MMKNLKETKTATAQADGYESLTSGPLLIQNQRQQLHPTC